MEFQIEATYDRRSTKAIARSARKTLRRKRNLALTLFAWGVGILWLILEFGLVLIGEFQWDGPTVLSGVALLVVVLSTFFQDDINAWAGLHTLLPQQKEVTACFGPGETYLHRTQMAETAWQYDQLQRICETADYFVFLLDRNHGQVYGKRGFVQGTPDEFREFIAKKTGKPVEYIK